MTKKELLSLKRPSQLFTKDNFKNEYRKYAKANHPDNGGSIEVMMHINALYEKACKLYESDQWDSKDSLQINGTPYPFDSKNFFELGIIYISDKVLIYQLYSKYASFPINTVTSFPFPDIKLQKLVPEEMHTWTDPLTKDIYYIISKPEGSFLLKDILTKFPSIPEKHVAWIISRLYNIGCLLEANNLVHLDISLNSVLINPETHWAGIYGGWWYCYKKEQTIMSLPVSTYKILPYSSIKDKKAVLSLMGIQIKALAKELLGDRFGDIHSFEGINKGLVEYLIRPGEGSLIKEFINWDKNVLDSIYGPRKYIDWRVTKEDIYY
jgi:serine/threonine protein kinase